MLPLAGFCGIFSFGQVYLGAKSLSADSVATTLVACCAGPIAGSLCLAALYGSWVVLVYFVAAHVARSRFLELSVCHMLLIVGLLEVAVAFNVVAWGGAQVLMLASVLL
jgi:hypothetical protein